MHKLFVEVTSRGGINKVRTIPRGCDSIFTIVRRGIGEWRVVASHVRYEPEHHIKLGSVSHHLG